MDEYSVKEFSGLEGSLDECSVAIVVSRYHESITSKLLSGAVKTLVREGVPENQIHVARVPGAWEIPLAAEALLEREELDYHAIICLGCVIKGETTHDLHINTMVSTRVGEMSIEYSTPCSFGVLTCNTMEQAIARSGGSVGNKGVEAAEAAIEMIRLLEQIEN